MRLVSAVVVLQVPARPAHDRGVVLRHPVRIELHVAEITGGVGEGLAKCLAVHGRVPADENRRDLVELGLLAMAKEGGQRQGDRKDDEQSDTDAREAASPPSRSNRFRYHLLARNPARRSGDHRQDQQHAETMTRLRSVG